MRIYKNPFGFVTLKRIIVKLLCRLNPIVELKNPIKISFIIVGAQKSGTTALYHFIGQHPDLVLSRKKETDFFCSEKYWKNGENYKVYKRFFRGRFKKVCYGEASPLYLLKHKTSAYRIANYNKDVKLIFILKNPIERAISQFKMHQKKYNLKLTLSQCLEISKNNNTKGIDIDYNNPVTKNGSTETIKNYLEYGHYCEQIKTYQSLFNSNQMLILLTEDLLYDHKITMKKIFSFLKVSDFEVKQEIIHSNKASLSSISNHDLNLLRDEYSQEIDNLEKLLDRDLSHWKDV